MEYLKEKYSNKSDGYYSGARKDFVQYLPENLNGYILEVGSGTGSTGALALQRNRCSRYVGVEMHEAAAEISKSLLTTVHIGNVDVIELPYELMTFDALIMSEVLEHLIDPAATLRRLLPLIRPGGYVLSSSPNIAQWRIIAKLYRGCFDYEQEGVMDATHLRWFTPKSYQMLFEQFGVKTEHLVPLGSLSKTKRLFWKIVGLGRDHLNWGQINYFGRIPDDQEYAKDI